MPDHIPKKLIEKTAFEICRNRQKEYSDEDYQKAREYLEQNPKLVQTYKRRHRLLTPVFWVERRFEDVVDLLNRMAFFEILDFAGKAAIILAVYGYFTGAEDRQKEANYQAWQVINSSAGQVHGGGRKAALEDLHANQVSLVGIDLENAYIPELELEGAHLSGANLSGANLENANLSGAKLNNAKLMGADLENVNLQKALPISAKYLKGAKLKGG